jgi:hypothetical protein
MNNFWESKNIKQVETQIQKSFNIDGITPRITQPAAIFKPLDTPEPRKKIKWRLWTSLLLTFVFVMSLMMSGFWAAEAHKNQLNVLKLIRSGKYLVLFQNNAEMRASGGFIGSFAIITFDNYQVKNIDINTNIYKIDQAYAANHIIPPPKPFLVFVDKWAMRDSNYAVSFPEAAKQVEWFYNQETGDNVDGVIAVNASVVRDLLQMTGPIKLDSYDTSISYENFFTELTTQIEKNYFADPNNRDTNEPKSILKDLLPVLAHQVIAQNKLELIKKIYAEISEKQIVFYSHNPQIQESILAENWGGEIQPSKSDYLAINNSNMGGGKSSLSVAEAVNYKVTDNIDKLLSNLTITRSHAGTNVWPDGTNNNYTRILVPLGSSLVSATLNGKDVASHVDIGTEAGKTCFAITLATGAGTSDVINLTYNLPISKHNYELLVQKQPGNLGDKFSANFRNQLLFDGILNSDKNIPAN